MHALLEALGQPQAELQVAHISGTKGKGSTAVMLSSIMKAADYKVGTYTRHAAPPPKPSHVPATLVSSHRTDAIHKISAAVMRVPPEGTVDAQPTRRLPVGTDMRGR